MYNGLLTIRVAGTTPLVAAAGSLPLADAADAPSAVSRCGIRHGDERDPQRVRDLATLPGLALSNAARRTPANGGDAVDSIGQRSVVATQTRGSCHVKLGEYNRSASSYERLLRGAAIIEFLRRLLNGPPASAF